VLDLPEVRAEQGCYLLCFADTPVAHARHYLGYADDIARRVEEHRNGTANVKLTDALHRAGGRFEVVRVWPGATPQDEARMKGRNYRAASPAMRNKGPRKRGGAVAHYCPNCQTAQRDAQKAQKAAHEAGRLF
jgi:predicted GIY-YIG superfamily endonuclease